jgi:protein TonB
MVTDSIGSESTAAEEAVESAAGGTEPVAESSDTTATDDDVEEIDLAATSEAEPLDFTAPAPAAGDAGAAGAATDTGAQPVAASPGFPPPALEVTLEVRSRLEPEPGGASLAETASLPSLLTTLADQMEPPLPQGRTPSGSPAAAAPEPPPGMLDPETGDYEGLYPLSDLRVIEQKPPEYPPGVVPGTRASVDLELTVNPGGEVRDVRVVGKAGRIFEREALRAVYQWRFEPVRFAGERVAVRTAVRLTFRD